MKNLLLFFFVLTLISCGPDERKARKEILQHYGSRLVLMDEHLQALEILDLKLIPANESQMDSAKIRYADEVIEESLNLIQERMEILTIEERRLNEEVASRNGGWSYELEDDQEFIDDMRKELTDAEKELHETEDWKATLGKNKSEEKDYYKAVFKVRTKTNLRDDSTPGSCFMDKNMNIVFYP